MRKSATAIVAPAIDRLRVSAPDGPPFLGLILDEATVRCLAGGAVNARAEVEARRVLKVFESLTACVEKRT